MITIRKTVTKEEFIIELKELVRLITKYKPDSSGVGLEGLNEAFGLNLTILDFFKIAEILDLEIYKNKFLNFKDIMNLK